MSETVKCPHGLIRSDELACFSCDKAEETQAWAVVHPSEPDTALDRWLKDSRAPVIVMQQLANLKRVACASAPVEAGTAALDELLNRADQSVNDEGDPFATSEEIARARSELLALKRAAAGRDAVLEECAAICDRAAREWPREPASANDAAFRIRAMQSPPATGEVSRG